jgi:hypothetical protein
MGSNKPRGLQAARKLRNDRRENRWVSLGPVISCLVADPLLAGRQELQKARSWQLL